MAAHWHMRLQGGSQLVEIARAIARLGLALIALGGMGLARAAATVPNIPAGGNHDTPTDYAKRTPTVSEAPSAYFDWFEYAGHDSVFDTELQPRSYRNPILTGFHPDPGITRRGDVYYLVNSSSVYFPGIPVFESRDLVHWRHIGNVIDRPNEVNFDGLSVSQGMSAPTIRFHDGLFYVVCTSVNAGGNFLTVANNPEGPWSDPIFLPEVEGVDPSLFFDDGKTYLLTSGPPDGTSQYGQSAIRVQEFNPGTRKFIGPRKVLLNGGVGIAGKPVSIGGPHLYRHDRWYFLMYAKGGASTQHSEMVLRSRSPWGPFEPFAGHPILTQRGLPPDRLHPVINPGHADLIETSDGSWWAVFQASRPYENVHFNTGRETFLLPVTWTNGWPTIAANGKKIPYRVESPKLNAKVRSSLIPTTGNFVWRDDFNGRAFDRQWCFVRIPKQPWADLGGRLGWLTLHALRTPLDSLQNMSFLARRQQHTAFEASTELEVPANTGLAAGLAAFQNENYWYFFGIRRREGADSPLELFVEKRAGKQTDTIARVALKESARVKLKVAGNARAYSFYFDAGAGWQSLKENDDGSILSTDVAGGSVGALVGPYARAE